MSAPTITPRASTRARIEDLEHLIRCDVSPEAAACRCGWTIEGAEQAARRHGSPELARIYGRHRAAHRRTARRA